MNKEVYNTNLLKSTGLIQETIALIETYKPGMSKKELYSIVTESNLLSKATNTRIKDIIDRAFYQRFMAENEEIVINLKYLRTKYISNDAFIQLLLIYTCRANSILFDFIKLVYYDAVNRGYQIIDSSDSLKFIDEAIKDGGIEKPWSDSTKKRVSRHIMATLADFKLIDSDRKILPFFISDITANYLMHELHFKGLSDPQILDAKDWTIFGINKNEILILFERLSFKGHFIYQHSGELLKISWKYNSMKESIDGITR